MPPNLHTVERPAEDGFALLDKLRDALTTYVAFPSDHAADAVTLWIAATHAQGAWEHAPRLAAISPEKRCGKSRLMNVVEGTCRAPLTTVNASTAAVVRSIGDDDPPTLLVDEADTLFGSKVKAEQNEDVRGILNAGHERNRPYLRWDMTTRSLEHCPTFAMAMLASIGDLPDTVMDRAVVVRMRRRAPGETVAPFRTRRDAPALHELRDRLEWLSGHTEQLAAAVPDLPVEDRAADTWEPLVAVADLAGRHWPERARAACLALVAEENNSDAEASLGARLLSDVRALLDSSLTAFIATKDLLSRLRSLDESPWRDLELSTNALADRLRPYRIRPKSNGSVRGYRREDFAEAFTRYLPPPKADDQDNGPSDTHPPSTAVNPSANGADLHKRTDTPDGTDTPGCQAVNDRKPLTSGNDILTGTDGGRTGVS